MLQLMQMMFVLVRNLFADRADLDGTRKVFGHGRTSRIADNQRRRAMAARKWSVLMARSVGWNGVAGDLACPF